MRRRQIQERCAGLCRMSRSVQSVRLRYWGGCQGSGPGLVSCGSRVGIGGVQSV